MKINVYVHHNTTKDGKEYSSFSAKIKTTKEWANIVFSKNVEKPEVDSTIELDRVDIFKSKSDTDNRPTYIIMKIKSIGPIESNLIEEDFFY